MNGILIVDKPKTWTSHDVCNFIRKRFRIDKVGHAGILDPQATGVLVVLSGTYTKYSQKFSSDDKEYEGLMELGRKTDSHDSMGKIIAEGDWSSVDEEKLKEVFDKFTGPGEQTPPMTCALRHKGVRLYKLARKGKEIERPKKNINVHRLEITQISLPFVEFSCTVSKGTYVRTLANDIGEHLGCFAYLKELRRVKSGVFSISDAADIDTLKRLEDRNDLKSFLYKDTYSLLAV